VKVIHYGTYRVRKYVKIICDIALYGKSLIMSRMKNALYSPTCAQPSGPNELLKLFWKKEIKQTFWIESVRKSVLLPREDVDAPSLEVFRARLDGALSNLI